MDRGSPPGGREPTAGHGPRDYRLPPSSRIHRASEIRFMLGRGKRRRTDHLDVFFAPSPVSSCRWGIVVPKHRHTVVRRNLLRRRLREIGRTEILPRLRAARCEMDVLVRARREAYGASFGVLRDELVEVAEALCSVPSSSG